MTDVLEPPAARLRTSVVATANGPVRGYAEAGVQIFKGVRYGAPPTGSRRFRPPERPQPWTEPADALELGTPALQAGLPPGEKSGGRSAGDPPAPGEPGTGEDCLFLNVWTPGSGRGRAAGDGLAPRRRLRQRLGRGGDVRRRGLAGAATWWSSPSITV